MATKLLVSPQWLDEFGADLTSAARDAGLEFEPVLLPRDPAERVDPAACTEVEVGLTSFLHRSASISALTKCPRLHWAHLHSAGADHAAYQSLLANGVRLTTSSGANAEPIAQSAVGGMLALARGFLPDFRNQSQRLWPARNTGPGAAELRSQTLLVFGLGAIGLAVARIAQAIGMRVVGVRRSGPRPGEPVDEVITPAEVDAMLPRVDWLLVSAPLTSETTHFFNAERLALLPAHAHVLNVARGRIVNEAALVDALASGRLGGAYLDVFEVEPLPAESPLWALPNVIVSPHHSGDAEGNVRRAAEMFFANLGPWTRGEPLRNEIFVEGGAVGD